MLLLGECNGVMLNCDRSDFFASPFINHTYITTPTVEIRGS